MARTPYFNLWERLVANSTEPEASYGCWPWTKRTSKGYARIDVYIPGLGRNVTLSAHVSAWVWLQAEPQNIDEFYLAYLEYRHSDLELDHSCVNSTCINPDHVEPVDAKTNCWMRDKRRRA